MYRVYWAAERQRVGAGTLDLASAAPRGIQNTKLKAPQEQGQKRLRDVRVRRPRLPRAGNALDPVLRL